MLFGDKNKEFQSSPALSGRCNIGMKVLKSTYTPFQSSPALSGRCNLSSCRNVVRLFNVSILTGPFRPVQPRFVARARARALRFNPHRPFQAGATHGNIFLVEGIV